VISTTDITQLKLIETQLQRSQKLESLGVLAGGIAHDFNNLMGGIYGLIDLANEETDSKIVSAYLSKALATIDRARELTAQLLTFATGGAPVQTLTSLIPFIQDTTQITLNRLGLFCKFEIDTDLFSCKIDKNQIRQVINNIITNAKEAMPKDGIIEIIAKNVTLGNNDRCTLTAGNYVKISIKDSGIGIPEKTIPRIFDPFFTTKEKSHGLGLPTSYSIINRHGGVIDVESVVGKGSTFHIYLPASTDPRDASVVPAKKQTINGNDKGTIIVMDDEDVMRETISTVLESLGYSVVSKSDGREVLAFFIHQTKSQHTIAGLLLDLTVPGGMGGKAVVEEIRKIDSEIPVFVASGYADDPVMKNPVKFGFNASICKPFRKFELAEMLQKYLRN
jgi:CheY-like chemotaxis protein